LYDNTGVGSIAWDNRRLYDELGNPIMDWNSGQSWISDTSGTPSIYFVGRQLNHPSYGPTLDWLTQQTFDAYGIESLDWLNRNLVDNNAFTTVDWDSCILYSTSGTLAIDWAGTEIDLYKNTILNKANPQAKLYDSGDSAYSYIQKLTTNNEHKIVSQNRPYVSGLGVTVSTVSQRASFGTHTFSNWSLAFWIKTSSSAQNMFAGRIIDNNTALVYFESNQLLYRISGTTKSFTGYSGLYDNNWHHVVFAVAKNANTYVYVDGVQSAAQTGTNADITLTHILGGGTGSVATGTFDEILLYDSQISAATVTSLYNAGAPIKLSNYTGVYAAWHLDDGSGTTYTDSSGNLRNATAGAAVTWATGKVPSAISALEDVDVQKLVVLPVITN
jgi:hypothetical protein